MGLDDCARFVLEKIEVSKRINLAFESVDEVGSSVTEILKPTGRPKQCSNFIQMGRRILLKNFNFYPNGPA